ncbi:beta-glucan synthesis-associated protein, partial [Teratosphaeriaceae sp. CCFEE 6253]
LTNEYAGGVYQQALSIVTNLNNEWYDGNAYQTYGFDYTPGDTGSIAWNVGDTMTWKVDANAVGPNGNIGQR